MMERLALSSVTTTRLFTFGKRRFCISYAGALLAGVIGGFIAYAVIGGAKKLRVIIEEKVAAKKLAEAAKTDKAEIDSADEDSEEN